MKRYLLIILCISLLFSSCSISTTKKTCIKIGVTGIENLEKCEEYLGHIIQSDNVSFRIIDLGEGSADAFSNVFYNINSLINEEKIDMIIGIPEDYVLSQPENVFMDLSEIDLNFMLPAVLNHLRRINSSKVSYIPDAFYCTRYLIVNKDLLNSLDIKVPVKFNNLDEVIAEAYNINNKIISSEQNSAFAISFGSPYDEFLYDDIANLLLPYGFARTESGIQKRFFSDNYLESYKKIYECATSISYSRNDIGHTYALDYYFATGNVAMKIATAYELSVFKHKQQGSPFNAYIKNFDYDVIPFSSDIMNTQSTVTAIAANTVNKSICTSILKFLIGKDYATDVLNNNSPFLSDKCSLPCYTSKEIEQKIFMIYGIHNLDEFSDYTMFPFVKDSKTHWDIINQERSIFQSNMGGDSEEIINKLQSIK